MTHATNGFRGWFRGITALALLAATARAADPPAPPGWTLVFRDDFDRPTIGCDWVVVRGDWRLEDGRLRVTRLPGWTSDSFIRTAMPLRENVRLEFDVQTPEATVVKAAMRIGDQYWDGGGAPRGGRGAGGRIAGEIVMAGNPDPAADFTALASNRVARVALQYEDGRFQAWVDGQPVRDEPARLDGAFNDYVALFTVRSADWDNVRIYAKPYGTDFARTLPRATADSNRRATVDAAPLIDRAKADCGIQAAIDALPPGGGAVILPKGEFILRRALALRVGVSLRGQGSETRLALPSPIPILTLTAPARAGDTQLSVAGTAGFVAGAMLHLANYYGGPGDFRLVKSVSERGVELDRPLAGDLPEGRVVANFFPVIFAANTAGVDVRDFDIVGRAEDPVAVDGGYGVSAVTFFFVRDIRVCNVAVHGWKGDAFSFQGGRDILCAGNAIRGAAGNGYHPGSCQQRTILSRCRAEDCGGDGFYFCRYNQMSVMGNNTYTGCRRGMIGGLASAGDMFNTINRNHGRGNASGVAFIGGANDVFCDNVIEDGPSSNVVFLSGGDYAKGPKEDHVYTGPSRYHVLAGNRVSAKAKAAAGPLMVLEPGAAANVVAGNRFSSNPGLLDLSGLNVSDDNGLLKAPAAKPAVPPVPPALPEPVTAAGVLDESLPDLGLQKRLDAAAKSGGTLRLPAGEYRLGVGLTIPSRVTLCGEGVATRLLWSGAGPAIRAAGAAGIGVRRLCVAGALGAPDRVGVDLRAVTNAVVEGVDIEEMGAAGLAVSGGVGVLVSQCRLRRCGTGLAAAGVAGLTLAESFVLDSLGDAVAVREPAGTVDIDSAIVWFQRGGGIRVEQAPAGTVTIRNNVVAFSGENGIRLTDARGVTIRGNVVVNSSLSGAGAHAGIRMDGATSRCTIEANRVGDDMFAPLQVAAVEEAETAGGNHVRYNVLCPVNRPGGGAGAERAIAARGKDSVFEFNVREPYTGPR